MGTKKINWKYLTWPLIIFIIALVIRVIYFFEIKNNPLFLKPISDAKIYHIWANQIIVTKDLIGKEPFFLNPGYAYLLSLIYSIFTPSSVHLVQIIQFIVGAISSVLVYQIASKCFDKTTGILAGIINALYGIFIFYEGFLLTFVWINFLNLILILLLLRAKKQKSFLLFFFIGLITGVSALFRPNILLLVPLLIVWFFLYKQKYSFRLFLFFPIGIIFILCPIILRNYFVLKEPIISSVSSGINFYIGNNSFADGSNGAINSLGAVTSQPRYMLNFFKQRAEEKFRRNISYREMDLFWLKEGLGFIFENPMFSFHLLVKKIFLFINSKEIPSNYPYEILKEFSKTLKYCINYSLIFSLAFFPVIFLGWNNEESVLLKLFFAVHFFTTLIFFVISEYRAPAVPILIMFCANGIQWLWRRIKTKDYRNIFLFLIVSTIIFKVTNLPIMSGQMVGEYHWKGIISKQLGDSEKAKYYFQRSIELNPLSVSDYQQLGSIFYESGDYNRAKYWFSKSLDIYPTAEAYNNIGIVYFKMNNFKAAREYFVKSINIDETISEAWNGLASAEWELGNEKAAHNAWSKALIYASNFASKSIIERNIKIAKSSEK